MRYHATIALAFFLMVGGLGFYQVTTGVEPPPCPGLEAEQAPGYWDEAQDDGEEEHHHSHHSADTMLRQRLNEEMKTLEKDGRLSAFTQLAWSPRNAMETLPKPSEEQIAPQDLYERVADATVMFHTAYKCSRCEDWHGGVATGFVVHPDGWVVTAAHVVDDLEENRVASVMMRDGTTHPVRWVGAIDSDRDTALVQIDARDLLALPLAESNPDPGTPIYVISHPQNHFYYMTQGIVSRVLGDDEPVPSRLQITAGYATGSSGGPVVDERGNIVGMVIATRTLFADRREHDSPQLVIRSCAPVEDIRRAIAR